MSNRVFNKLRDWHNPMWLLGMQLMALWPHWVWMARRSVDGSDEPWGVVALLTLMGMVIADRQRLRPQLSAAVMVIAGCLSLASALCMPFVPPIITAAMAIMSVVALLSGMLPEQRPRAALATMALLALPLTASLNFYFGYPLRWLCAHGAAGMLSIAGWQVTPEGAALLWNGKTILVDAPCAGIAMLWVGCYVAALMSYVYRASLWRTAFNLLGAAVIVLLGNVVRNAALFFKEAGIAELPGWTHEGIGLLLFGCVLLLMAKLFSWRSHVQLR
ncbi:MAG: archaeosortase/exosortase family protein [Sulfuritalea sp.]|nr:archaeosortase/exosortase family protein [Sulfuritalea sp.]MDP1981714.1 archaeosortase/exosortase family protein [Sulfuritalea sp.]